MPRVLEEVATAVQSITANDLSAHLNFLASEALEGREPARRGGEIAARYVAAEFMKYGLKPIGDNGGLIMNFDMIGRNETSNSEYKIPDGLCVWKVASGRLSPEFNPAPRRRFPAPHPTLRIFRIYCCV